MPEFDETILSRQEPIFSGHRHHCRRRCRRRRRRRRHHHHLENFFFKVSDARQENCSDRFFRKSHPRFFFSDQENWISKGCATNIKINNRALVPKIFIVMRPNVTKDLR